MQSEVQAPTVEDLVSVLYSAHLTLSRDNRGKHNAKHLLYLTQRLQECSDAFPGASSDIVTMQCEIRDTYTAIFPRNDFFKDLEGYRKSE